MLPSLPASPAVPPTTTLQQDLPEPPDISNPNPLFSSSGPSPSDGASDALPHIPKASAARVPPGARSYNDLLVVGPGLPDEAMREEVLRAEVVCIEEPGDASRDDIRRSLRLDDVVRK